MSITTEQMKELAQLADEQIKRVVHKIPLLGPVTWLMLQQPATRHTLVGDLEWRIMPPLVLDQAKLYMRDESPLAFVSWALLSEQVAQRYRFAPHQLTIADWQSGDQVWIIDLLTPFGGAKEVMNDVRQNLFAGQTVYQLAPVPQGEAKVLRWEDARAAKLN